MGKWLLSYWDKFISRVSSFALFRLEIRVVNSNTNDLSGLKIVVFDTKMKDKFSGHSYSCNILHPQ